MPMHTEAPAYSHAKIVPPENCDVAERNFCATFAFSRNRTIFAIERNFGATLADFGLFLR